MTIRIMIMTLVACATGVSFCANFTVVPPRAPKPWETTAARELTDYLSRRVGDCRLTVAGATPRFHVGDTDFAATKGLSGTNLKDEEWVVRSFGSDVVINGGGSHGALYALYHFLEDVCDIRFFSESEEEIPPASDLSFASIDLRGKPFFYFRDIYVWHSEDSKHAPIAIKRRLNGFGAIKLPVELGGFAYHGRPAFTHTMHYYISWEEYGKTHPEYFSLWKGKRVGGMHDGNHCISNPEVWKIFKRCVFEDIEKSNAEARRLGVPPPRFCELEICDTDIHCECPDCAKLVEKYGWSGAYLREINKIAAAVKEKYPDRLVNFTAYLFTEPAPKGGVVCAENVGVNANDTKGNWAAGWYDSSNDRTRTFFEDWSKICNKIIFNGFTVTFGSYCKGFPFPNEFLFSDRFKFMAERKFLGFFIEHEEHDGIADMHDLKFYVMTKLAEDPFADQDAIIRDFLSHYLGPAADDVYAARRRLAKCCKENDGKVIWSPMPTFQFIHSDDQRFIEGRFAAARAKVKGVERYERRLEKCWTGFRLLFEQRKMIVKADGDRFRVRGGCFETGWGKDIDGEKGMTPDNHNPDRELELPNCGPLRVTLADWLGGNPVVEREVKVSESGESQTIPLGEVKFGHENGLWISTGGHAARAIVTPSGLIPGKTYRMLIELRATKDVYAVKQVVFK